MTREPEAINIVERARMEILFAIKERLRFVTEGTGAPVRLKRVVINDRPAAGHEALRYFEINNVYLDDGDRLCGDMTGRDDRSNDGIIFGRELEGMAADDLKSVLDALYGMEWSVDLADFEGPLHVRRMGLQAFIMDAKAGISRALRRGA
ncbi:MAG: hypothetical protein E4G96_11125 [Chrysiogenales bacterium]|nr:MAG: hypothetical protein E4G96_11125 [Chrysiogenales bacterium]